MTRILQRALMLLTLAATSKAVAFVDGGGKDVTVTLFSSHALHALTFIPQGPHTWIAHCATCKHEPTQSPLHLSGSTEIFAGGAWKITDASTSDSRSATGLWHIRSSGARNELDVVLTIPSERYVAAVLNAEASPREPVESLQALAVVARTYALNGPHYTAQLGHLPADLCDSTACQAMLPGDVSDAIATATRATAGETLWFGDHRADVYFSQSCGGVTEDASAVWPALHDRPYLRSHADPYCVRLDRTAWHAEVSIVALADIARLEGWHIPNKIVAVQVTQRTASHRALRVGFTGIDGATSIIAANALRLGIGRALGWNRVRSDAYDIALRKDNLVFDGHGHGHGVGLCQLGATAMASRGISLRDILAFYFPGATPRVLVKDAGWQESNLGALIVRSTMSPTDSAKKMMLQTWSEAQNRFQPRQTVTPTIVFAPSTEIFRQLTTQPGWALASTQGNTIVMQPDVLFRTQNISVNGILLHEMLHVLVETESTDRAPLWLREGLVEVLSAEHNSSTLSLPTTQIDSALRNSTSLIASRQAHLAAAACVRKMIAHHGMSAVRDWLRTGVPAGVV